MKGIINTSKSNYKWKNKKRKKLKNNNYPLSEKDLIIYKGLMNYNLWNTNKINMNKQTLLLKLTFMYCLQKKEKLKLYNCNYDISYLINLEINNFIINQKKTISMMHLLIDSPIYDSKALRRTYSCGSNICDCWICICHRNITNDKIYKSKYCGIKIHYKAMYELKKIVPIKSGVFII